MGLARRLYRGETNIDFIGVRRRWYIASAVLLLICIGSMVINGFNFGIEFSGGSQFVVPKPAGTTLAQAEEAAEDTGVHVLTAQEVGGGGQPKYVLKTPKLDVDTTQRVKRAVAESLGIDASAVNDSTVSSSWGEQVTNKALVALVVFLVLVSIYLWIRFEQKMALAALFALIHDLVLTAGIYSLVGFEVTPATVIGLLTILGFSLYDTVVVFDKVEENTKGILGGSRLTYAEAANLAVNQTLMRSINTSLISLLPVSGLLFVGAGLLGVGTLKDLALVLFVGLLSGAYSSLFLATPWLVEMKEREPRYAALRQRVAARRGDATNAARRAARAEVAGEDEAEDGESASDREVAAAGASSRASGGAGSRPGQRRRAGGKPGRPSGSKRRR